MHYITVKIKINNNNIPSIKVNLDVNLKSTYNKYSIKVNFFLIIPLFNNLPLINVFVFVIYRTI